MVNISFLIPYSKLTIRGKIIISSKLSKHKKQNDLSQYLIWDASLKQEKYFSCLKQILFEVLL